MPLEGLALVHYPTTIALVGSSAHYYFSTFEHAFATMGHMQSCNTKSGSERLIYSLLRGRVQQGGVYHRGALRDHRRVMVSNVYASTGASAQRTVRNALAEALCTNASSLHQWIEPEHPSLDSTPTKSSQAGDRQNLRFQVWFTARTERIARILANLLGTAPLCAPGIQPTSPSLPKVRGEWMSRMCPKCHQQLHQGHECDFVTFRVENRSMDVPPFLSTAIASKLRLPEETMVWSIGDRFNAMCRAQRWCLVQVSRQHQQGVKKALEDCVASDHLTRVLGPENSADDFKGCSGCGNLDSECGEDDHVEAHRAYERTKCPRGHNGAQASHPPSRLRSTLYGPSAVSPSSRSHPQARDGRYPSGTGKPTGEGENDTTPSTRPETTRASVAAAVADHALRVDASPPRPTTKATCTPINNDPGSAYDLLNAVRYQLSCLDISGGCDTTENLDARARSIHDRLIHSTPPTRLQELVNNPVNLQRVILLGHQGPPTSADETKDDHSLSCPETLPCTRCNQNSLKKLTIRPLPRSLRTLARPRRC